jgi:hypothetical protein
LANADMKIESLQAAASAQENNKTKNIGSSRFKSFEHHLKLPVAMSKKIKFGSAKSTGARSDALNQDDTEHDQPDE